MRKCIRNKGRWTDCWPETCVDDLLDDGGHLTPQHGVEQFDDEDEADTEHQERRSEQDQSHCQVGQCRAHENMTTYRHRQTARRVLTKEQRGHTQTRPKF